MTANFSKFKKFSRIKHKTEENQFISNFYLLRSDFPPQPQPEAGSRMRFAVRPDTPQPIQSFSVESQFCVVNIRKLWYRPQNVRKLFSTATTSSTCKWRWWCWSPYAGNLVAVGGCGCELLDNNGASFQLFFIDWNKKEWWCLFPGERKKYSCLY